MSIKIHWMLFKNRLRQAIFRFLIKILKRLDEGELKRCLIGIKMSWNLAKFVPKDNQWHHVAMTGDAWIKRVKNATKKKQSQAYYLDGIRIRSK